MAVEINAKAQRVTLRGLANQIGAALVAFIASGVGAVKRTTQDKLRETVSVKDFGAVGDGVTNDAAAIQAAIDAVSAAGGGDLYFPDGTYNTASTIVHKTGVTLRFGKLATLRATAAMAALLQGPSDAMLYRVGVYGGFLNCNSLADVGYDAQFFQHLTVEDLTVEDYLVAGVRYGLSGTPSFSYEHLTRNLRTFRPSAAVPAGSIGLHVRAASDGQIIGGIIEGAEIGVKTEAGGNVFIGVHPWTRASTGQMQTGFWDTSFGNMYIGCYADTPTEVGFQLDGRRYSLIGCKVYVGENGGASDNTTVGVVLNNTDVQTSIQGLQCEGSTGALRMLRDIDYSAVVAANSVEFVGNISQKNVTNIAPTIINKLASLSVSGAVTAGAGVNSTGAVVSTAAAGSSARGLTVQSAGVDRFKLRADTAAESGSNAGSNVELVLFNDAGSFLRTSMSINRATGQVTMNDAGLTLAGTYNKPLSLGAYNLWVNVTTGNLMIKNGAPANDADGTIVGTQT